MTDIRRWLESLGLGEYAGVFAENAVDLEVLPDVLYAVVSVVVGFGSVVTHLVLPGRSKMSA